MKQQVMNVLQVDAVRNHSASRGRGRLAAVHEWLFRLEDGRVEKIVTVSHSVADEATA